MYEDLNPQDLFIPPAGAMQFELIPNESRKTDALCEWEEAFELDVIWVASSVPSLCCKVHAVAYPVLAQCLPESLANKVLSDPREIVVCACHGRIIE
jgi:hypothetical protein